MKNTITTITLAIVLTFGATFANAGILVSDRQELVSDSSDGKVTTCTKTEKNGLIIGNIATIINNILGLIIGNKPVPCTEANQDKNGLIIGN